MTTKSSSNTSSATQTSNEDNRIAAEGGSLALGKNAALQINNQLPETVVDVFKDLIELAGGAGNKAIEASQKAIASSEQTLSTIANIADNQSKGESRIYTDLFPILAVGVIGLVAVTLLKKGK